MDVLSAVREAGLGEVKSLKFYDNRTNGQSKGYLSLFLLYYSLYDFIGFQWWN